MKKIIRAISVMVLMLASVSVSAGGPGDLYLFNHLGIGAHVGTTGFGFEAATPITKWVTLRGIQRDRGSGGDEEPHQRRFFRDAQFGGGGAARP